MSLEGDLSKGNRRRRLAEVPEDCGLGDDEDEPTQRKPGRKPRGAPKGRPLDEMVDDLESLERAVEASNMAEPIRERLTILLAHLKSLPKEALSNLRILKARVKANPNLTEEARLVVETDIAMVIGMAPNGQQKAMQRLNDAFVLKIRTRKADQPKANANLGGRNFEAGISGTRK